MLVEIKVLTSEGACPLKRTERVEDAKNLGNGQTEALGHQVGGSLTRTGRSAANKGVGAYEIGRMDKFKEATDLETWRTEELVRQHSN
jgi:hypothetical protein